jgi:hypothetical protein
MHPVHLSRRMDEVDERIVALSQQLADTHGLEYRAPAGFESWRRNMNAPVPEQLLYHAEVVAEALRLLVVALPVALDQLAPAPTAEQLR